jgi:hypothetical protein
MDVAKGGELRESQVLALSQSPDSPVYGTRQTLSSCSHPTVLDQRSNFRKNQSTTCLVASDGPLSYMGHPPHKKSPPKAEMRPVTDLFVKQVAAALAANEVHNAQHKLKRGDRGYRPESQADLSAATGANQNAITDLLGGVRPGTKSKRPARSRLVDPLCDLLGIERMVAIVVPVSLVSLIERIAALPADLRAELEQTVKSRR